MIKPIESIEEWRGILRKTEEEHKRKSLCHVAIPILKKYAEKR